MNIMRTRKNIQNIRKWKWKNKKTSRNHAGWIDLSTVSHLKPWLCIIKHCGYEPLIGCRGGHDPLTVWIQWICKIIDRIDLLQNCEPNRLKNLSEPEPHHLLQNYSFIAWTDSLIAKLIKTRTVFDGLGTEPVKPIKS